jgi:putative peptidoglycan lipid II flippase
MEQDEKQSKIIRSTASVALPMLVSRVLGYVRDMLQAYFLGTGMSADAFTMAYTLPNLLRRLTAEGAMTAAFIPVFTDTRVREGREEMWAFARSFFGVLALVMAAVSLLGIFLSPILVKTVAAGFGDVEGKWALTIGLTRLMFPFILLISLAALATGILNSLQRFSVPAFAPVLFNISVIAGAVMFAARSEEPAWIFAAAVLVGGVLQLLFQWPALHREGLRLPLRPSFRHPGVIRVAVLMIPGIFSLGVYQVKFAVSRLLASRLEEGSVSALYYASRVEELTFGLFSIALAVVLLPSLSNQAAVRDREGIRKTLEFSLRLIVLGTLPAMTGLLLLSRPIMQVLFERGEFTARSTALSGECLFFLALGLPFISVTKILVTTFYSLQDTRIPAAVAFFILLAYVAAALPLGSSLGVGGLALALSITQMLHAGVLGLLLRRRLGRYADTGFWAVVLRSLAACALMAGAVIGVSHAVSREAAAGRTGILALAAAILTGIIVYGAAVFVLNRREFDSLRNALFRSRPGTRKEP